jgi:hypothetical protein
MEIKEKLKKAVELQELIETTELAIKNLSEANTETSKDNVVYKEGPYNLSISEHGDGSGWRLKLSRYYGNGKIIQLIKKELDDQLDFLLKTAEKL